MNWKKGNKPSVGKANSPIECIVWIIDIDDKMGNARAFADVAWYDPSGLWVDRQNWSYMYRDKITHYVEITEIDSPDDI
jgi:hypothetical protein